jgi:hypothetical protein
VDKLDFERLFDSEEVLRWKGIQALHLLHGNFDGGAALLSCRGLAGGWRDGIHISFGCINPAFGLKDLCTTELEEQLRLADSLLRI